MMKLFTSWISRKLPTNKMFLNVTKIASGTFLGQLVVISVSPILSRIYSPEDFGVLGMANVFIVFTQVFINLGLSNALVQKQETTQTQESTIFYLNLLIGIGLSLILFFSSDLISIFYVPPLFLFYPFSFY